MIFNWPILFRVASLALRQSHVCPTASEVTLTNMDNNELYQTTTKQSESQTLIIMHGMYGKHLLWPIWQHSSTPGPSLNIKTIFPGMGIPMLKIRRSRDRLIFNMVIPTPVRWHLYIEMAPSPWTNVVCWTAPTLWKHELYPWAKSTPNIYPSSE